MNKMAFNKIVVLLSIIFSLLLIGSGLAMVFSVKLNNYLKVDENSLELQSGATNQELMQNQTNCEFKLDSVRVENLVLLDGGNIKSVSLDTNNVYDENHYSTFWVLYAKVEYEDTFTELVPLNVNLTTEQLASGELVFENVELYNVDKDISFYVTLSRITDELNDYVNAYYTLTTLGTASSEAYREQALAVKQLYDEVVGSSSNLTELSQQRLMDYIKNDIVNVQNIDAYTDVSLWFSKVVESVDTSELQNVRVDYGTQNFQKNVTVTYIDGTSSTHTITYSIPKVHSLKVTATTEGFTEKVGNTTVFTFSEPITIMLNKLNITDVVLSSERDFEYDSSYKLLDVVSYSGVLPNDDVEIVLYYGGELCVADAGVYDVTVGELIGEDSIFYKIPSGILATLTIRKVEIDVQIINGNYVYDGTAQGPDVVYTALSGASVSSLACIIEVVGDNYYGSGKPIDAGDYTMTLEANSNYELVSTAETYCEFTIAPKEVVDFQLNADTFNYCYGEPNIEFVFEDNLTINDFTYSIYDENNNRMENYFPVGNYVFVLESSANNNYIINNEILKNIAIIPSDIEIQISNFQGVYGDDIKLDNITYSIVSGEYYYDDLELVYIKEEGNTVGSYEISATSSNQNYNITVNKGEYTIISRPIHFSLNETDLIYTGSELDYGGVSLFNIVETDRELFVFKITAYEQETVVKNAGLYTAKLVDNDYIYHNYEIQGASFFDFIVRPAILTVKYYDIITKYNNVIDATSIYVQILGNYEDISNMYVLHPYFLYNQQKYTTSRDLPVGQYVIGADCECLTDNYEVNIETAILTINSADVHLIADNETYTYNGQPINFTAQAYHESGELITDIEIEYTYYLNGEQVPQMIEVGIYNVDAIIYSSLNYNSARETYLVTINPSKVSVEFSGLEFEYNGQGKLPQFVVTCDYDVDVSSLYTYAIIQNGEILQSAVNVGMYNLLLTLVDSKNYMFDGVREVEFNISKAPLKVSISSASSVYGDDIDLGGVTWQIIDGVIYNQDSLNCYVVKESGDEVGEYNLSLIYSNNNYQVSVTNGIYTIEKRQISFEFGALDLTYNGNVQNIQNPQIVNVLNKDLYRFVFKTYKNDEFQVVEDAGHYTLLLEDDEYISKNYTIIGDCSFDFYVSKASLTITMQNNVISLDRDFSIADLTYLASGNYEELSLLVNVNAGVIIDGNIVYDISNITAGQYETTASVECLSSNYEVEVLNGTLTVINKGTYLVVEDVSVTYTGNPINVQAQMYTSSNELLQNATFTFIYTLNGASVDSIIDAGIYNVEVVGSADGGYQDSTATCIVEVLKNNVVVEFTDLNFEYDKQSHIPQINVTAEQNVDVSNLYNVDIYLGNTIIDEAVNVGQYVVTVELLSNSNFIITSENSVCFNIAQTNLGFIVSGASSIYGEDINLNNISYEMVSGTIYSGDIVNFTLVKESGNQVGNYSIGLVCDNANYNLVVMAGIYQIVKRAITIEYPQLNLVYDGTVKDIEYPQISNILNEDKDLIYFNVLKNGEITEVKDAGIYNFVLVFDDYINDNYEIQGERSKSFEVNRATIQLCMQDVSVMYSEIVLASELNFSITGCYETISDIISLTPYILTVEGKVYSSENLNVGEYEIGVDYELNSLNYVVLNKKATLKICGKQTYIKANDLQVIYSGQEIVFTCELYTMEDEKLDNATFDISYMSEDIGVNRIIDTGVYSVNVTGYAGDNYESATATYTVEVLKNSVSVTFENLEFTYDSQSKIPNIQVVTDDCVLSSIYKVLIFENGEVVANAINANEYVARVELLDYKNFEFETINYKSFVINPANVTMQIGSASSEYGNDIVLSGVSCSVVSGVVYDGDDLGYTLIKEDGCNVGLYEITATYTNTNYGATFISGKYEITKKIVDVTAKENGSYVYLQGKLNEVYNSQFDYDLIRLKDKYITLMSQEYLDNDKNATQVEKTGTYYLRCRLNDTENYIFINTNENLQDVEFVIEKAKIVVSVVVQGKVYDGVEIEKPIVQANGVELDNDLYLLQYYKNGELLNSTVKNAGEYVAKAITTDENNYEFIGGQCSFEITPKKITCELSKYLQVYSRCEEKPDVIMKGKLANDEVNFNVEYDGDYINVGTYKVKVLGIYGNNSDCYKFTPVSLNYVIYYATATAIVQNTEIVYSGKQIECEDLGLSIQCDALTILSSDYTVLGLGKDVGEYEIKVKSQNSNIVLNSVFTIFIKKADIVGAVFNGATFVYDGLTKEIFVDEFTLSDGTSPNIVYSGNGKVNVGEYEVVATITASNYNELNISAFITIEKYIFDVAFVKEDNYIYNKQPQGDYYVLDNNEIIASKVFARYTGIGNDYISESKPINAGKYKLEVITSDADNIAVTNNNTEFEIYKKIIELGNLSNQTKVYNTSEQEYDFSTNGILSGDDVEFNVLYDNKLDKPVNAGIYTVEIVITSGGSNYKFNEGGNKSLLTIAPKVIDVNATKCGKVYGESDAELEFTCSELSSSNFSGELVRQSGEDVGLYNIELGTLSAGKNYSINFIGNNFVISAKELNIIVVETQFVYDGNKKCVEVVANNLVNDDVDVIDIEYIGDRINVGNFYVNVIVLNNNYCLPSEYEQIKCEIIKANAMDNILGLDKYSSIYNGSEVQINAIIKEFSGKSLNYELSFEKNGESVGVICNAGQYNVLVSINEVNYFGEKEFEFIVAKAELNKLDIEIVTTSSSIKVEKINNALYSLNNLAFQSDNVFTNLESNTDYVVKVMVEESENYKPYISESISVRTTYDVNNVTGMLNDIGEFGASKLNDIRQLYKMYNLLSEEDKQNVDSVRYNSLINSYKQYMADLKAENEEVVKVSSLALSGLNIMKYLGSIFAFFVGLLIKMGGLL